MEKKVKVKHVLWKHLLKGKCGTSYVSAYVCVWCRAGIHRNGFSITTSSRSPITDYYHCTMPPIIPDQPPPQVVTRLMLMTRYDCHLSLLA